MSTMKIFAIAALFAASAIASGCRTCCQQNQECRMACECKASNCKECKCAPCKCESCTCKACECKAARKKCCRKACKPVWVLCRFDLKPDASRADYVERTKAVLAAVRAEKGCLEYRLLGDAATDWDKPQRFGERTLWMLEKWESVAALQAHLQTPHMKAFGPTVRPMRSASTFHVLEDVTE